MNIIFAWVRRVSLFLCLSILLCSFMFEKDPEMYASSLYTIAMYLFTVYAIDLIISILVRTIKNKKAYSFEFKIYEKNYSVISYFRGLSFMGFIVSLICCYITYPTMLNESGISSVYYGYLIWSGVCFIICLFLSALFYIFFAPHNGIGSYNAFEFVKKKMIVEDIAAPFRIIRTVFSRDAEGKPLAIVKLIFMIIFLLFNLINILPIIR